MKLIKRSVWLVISLLSVACSSDSTDATPTEAIDEEVEIEVLDLVNVQTIADTPIPDFDSFLVFRDKLYAVKAKDTYVFDFTLTTWSFLGTDTDMPNFLDSGFSFLRNGKWNLFTGGGLFEFDFDLEDWKVIDLFPQSNSLFYVNGFYLESEEALFFTDRANGNDTIYKYDLLTNELILYSTYNNEGYHGGIANNSFVVNGSHYLIELERSNLPSIYKFNDDFTELNSINNYSIENQLDGGVAMNFENYIIFGLGGIPTSDGENITRDPSTLKFYSYDVVNNIFAEMQSSLYESCRAANLVTYNNEFYLINGRTIKNQKSEARNSIEKIEFDFITQ